MNSSVVRPKRKSLTGAIASNTSPSSTGLLRIHANGSENAIEENLVTFANPGNGMNFQKGAISSANNKERGNGTNYNQNGTTNTDSGGNVGF